ncbi:MAG: hypothetical protein FWC95_06905, partial [Defluviitaleaceae bacterium]|nr:hypothetical protein [Defluviitaleaceae bacterium]
FRMQPGSTSEDLVGGEDGGGAGMNRAHDYLVTEWIPKNADKLLGYTAGQNGFGFNISKSEALLKTVNIPAGDIETGYSIYGSIEVYKTDIEAEPEMCYYLPIK